ncbi:hypothetical protein BVY04_03035 [bacterium M21]|nr:hypothetical protein BVY04_03035 [bacterium M21]
MPDYPILLVDDEVDIVKSQALALRLHQIDNTIICTDPRPAMDKLREHGCRLAIVDVVMPELSGLELLELIKEELPDVMVILLTGMNHVETAVASMKKGAFDYITKPLDPMRLATCVRKAIEARSAQDQEKRLKKKLLAPSLDDPEPFSHIVTKTPAIERIFHYIDAIGPTSLPVLLCGETGAGKELFARAVHKASGVKGEFVCVNCSGIDDSFFSDTIFGHRKGAFTGANEERDGLIARAANGTLFLDEIGDLRPESQVKLLRLLQEHTYYKLGADTPSTSNARIVAATNVDLREAQDTGTFRKDLYYRLESHRIDIPPLRERKDDLPGLVSHLVSKAAESLNKNPPAIPRELITMLEDYPFPGNVRELEGMVLNAVSRHQGNILACSLFRELISQKKPFIASSEPCQGITFPCPMPTISEIELAALEEALSRSKGNKSMAANLLGITRKTLRNKLSR